MKKILFITTCSFSLLLISLYPNILVSKADAATASQSASLNLTATVEQSLTFSIAGINNDTAINTGNVGCPNTERTNTGFNSSSTSVNLGRLSSLATLPNIAAQLILVTTNAQNGYALTATSSGLLTNTTNNYQIPSNTTPLPFQLGQPGFGIHPCGIDVPSEWRNDLSLICSTITSSLCKYAWPASPELPRGEPASPELQRGEPASPNSLTLASDSTGPIGNDLTPGNGITTVEYAAAVDQSVPGGIYNTIIRYLVTPTF